jgi:hypothetical protein
VHTAAEYRQYAQECIDSARSATSDAVRTQFLELWLTAAVQVELRKGDGGLLGRGFDQPSQDLSD